MKKKYLVGLKEVCFEHDIEISFISSLKEKRMLEISTIKEMEYIDLVQVQKLEKFTRLYYDLKINIEGIEVITDLLDRIMSMQYEVISLKNRLSLYESDDQIL
jgi:hypothetical protein